MVGRRCVGSSPDGGWLVTLDLALQPRILNPLTHKEFRLPSLLNISTNIEAIRDGSDGIILEFVNYRSNMTQISYPANIFRDAFIRRVIITDAPPNHMCITDVDPPNVVAVAFYFSDGCMALARPEDPRWVRVERFPGFGAFMDAVYCHEDQLLYVVAKDGSVIGYDLPNFRIYPPLGPRPLLFISPIPKICISPLNIHIQDISIKYLVFLDGELLQIQRTSKSYTAKGTGCEDEYNSPIVGVETQHIEVMRFRSGPDDTYDPLSCWDKVQDIGNYSLFIGCNHTLVVSISENSELRPNCVYFTDDSYGLCDLVQQRKAWDVGVYDIKNETIERFFPPDSDQQVIWPPPSWFMPPKLHLTFPK
ncbi:uncharacterized protein LOC110093255 [Dendrobium catenatum]|uniref:KIB1-4 beta-propeller domain-containing protein n=1 Tax=Dendrobium catenatum TaxID=906689 RepID=A0A2I0X596_9ASPA|nr:uncharacterized protein LOC110093255 [Dendrobium catenatum]PKU83094.1 hypothetical protein MA16_Dca007765 [Dendrobium catenatum]